MPDKEKVINGLLSIVSDDWMWEHADYYASIATDALALLKEQEPVKPIIERTHTGFWPLCGVCEGALMAQGKFCPHCGRAVKWDA